LRRALHWDARFLVSKSPFDKEVQMSVDGTIRYYAIHTKNPWRVARGHHSLTNALYGEKDGAPGLFSKKVRIDYAKHGDPRFVLIWRDGDTSGHVIRPEEKAPERLIRVEVPVAILEGFRAQQGVSVEVLEALFASVDPSEEAAVPEDGAEEGGRRLAAHLRIERNQRLVDAKKASELALTGALRCEACGFDFSQVYGEQGDGYCEVHHRTPLSDAVNARKTVMADLAILCSNCHSVIHRTDPMWTVEALSEHLSARA
jgi:5-methylcytosine-specific restriction protein A